jgi:hypothetical protein
MWFPSQPIMSPPNSLPVALAKFLYGRGSMKNHHLIPINLVHLEPRCPQSSHIIAAAGHRKTAEPCHGSGKQLPPVLMTRELEKEHAPANLHLCRHQRCWTRETMETRACTMVRSLGEERQRDETKKSDVDVTECHVTA